MSQREFGASMVESDVTDKGAHHEPESQRDETEADRLDRNYLEMLQELRVLQAGMQILFAFLLSLAFASRFDETTDFQRDLYIVTLVCAALATACLIAPVPFHRIVFRRGMKDDLIIAANRYVAAGLRLLVPVDGRRDPAGPGLPRRSDHCARGDRLAWRSVFVMLWVVIPLRSRATEADDCQDSPGDG